MQQVSKELPMGGRAMKVLFWINFAFGVLAVSYGAIVLRGVLRGTLRYKWPAGFLACSLLCMISVYCSAVAIAAWLKFHLSGVWRAVFAFSVTAVLYLDVLSGSVQLFTNSRVFSSALAGPFSALQVLQFVFTVLFGVLGVLVVRKSTFRRSARSDG
jgi:hypothetical protein